MKEQLPWYHSAEEISAALKDLAQNCGNGAEASVSVSSEVNAGSRAGQSVDVEVVRIRKSSAQPRVKALLVFGEHARELISPETALGFSQTLCGNGADSERAGQVLDKVEFVIVPNANPLSRKLVEDGDYCKRTNEDNVDLNRNWSDEHRDTSLVEGDEMYPGPRGFSEPETKILSDLVDQERPNIFLSIHSGAYLLGTPYGYSATANTKDQQLMTDTLRPISDKFCKGDCPYGNLAELINYQNPGCDIDYVYDRLQTPYVFTWEIYVGPQFRQGYIDEARERRSADDDTPGPGTSFLSARTKGTNSLRARTARAASKLMADATNARGCMTQFNPLTQAETQETVATWSGAFLELAGAVAARLDSPGSDRRAAPTAGKDASGDIGQAAIKEAMISMGGSLVEDAPS